MSSFSAHKNIAYRFLTPGKIAAAIDISVTTEPCMFTRLFLIFRGLSDDDVGVFAGAGEKEANQVNWREIVGWTEASKDTTLFRVLETSVLEVTWKVPHRWSLSLLVFLGFMFYAFNAQGLDVYALLLFIT
jgi:hypothetical protein